MSSVQSPFGFGGTTVESDIEAAAIIQLQLSVLMAPVNMKGKGKEKDTERSESDRELAMRYYREDLETAVGFFLDRAMARSIFENSNLSREAIDRRLSQKQQDMSEGRAQPSMPGIVVPRCPTEAESQEQRLHNSLVGKASTHLGKVFADKDSGYAEVLDDDDLPHAESSAWASSRPPKPRKCVACLSKTLDSQIVKLACGHEYCGECLESLFRKSMSDQMLFPPRCCRQPIPVNSVSALVSPEFVQEFEKKKAEFETPDKTYCYVKTCSAFISTGRIKGFLATCPDCRSVTCSNCKLASHEGDCPSDVALQQVKTLASTRGWQRCYACRQFVESIGGCNHMICRCTAKFCYRCGIKWKTCTCP